MGEARHRKLNDPNFGKPSKMRGLIISPPMTLEKNRLRSTDTGIDQQDLRSTLMYWDRLSWPQNNFATFPSTPDLEYLESAGILERPLITIQGSINPIQIFSKAQELALIDYEKRARGVWSIGQGVNSIQNIGLDNTRPSGTVIELLNAVPVPGPDVPLAEILEFKARRRDELLNFREHFEGLASRITEAADQEEDLRRVVQEVDQACSNLVKTTREWQFPVKLTNTQASINFDITKAITAAGAAYKGLALTPFIFSATGTVLATSGAAILSQLKLNAGLSYTGLKRPKSPYSYAYHVQRDLT